MTIIHNYVLNKQIKNRKGMMKEMFLAEDKPQKKQIKKGSVPSICAWSKAETSSSQARLSSTSNCC